MGGLITRWCLKDMEDRGLQHNVENYFSYDAPHQGANVPLGMQYLFREMIRDLPYLKFSSEVKKLDDAFTSSAARQLLVTYAHYDNSAFNWFPRLITLDPLRADFAQRLQAKGYPQQTRNFGLAFGRGNNTGNKDAGNGRQFTAANPFDPQTQIFHGSMVLFLINAEALANAVPENNTKATIAHYSFYGLTFRTIFGIPYRPVVILRLRVFKYTGQYPYDDAPGSFEQTQTDYARKWISGIADPATTNGHDGHNFEATVSGLDLQNQNYSAANNWQSGNMFFNIDNQILNPGQVNGNTLLNPALSPFRAVITGTSDCGTIPCSTPEPYKDENGNTVIPSNMNQWNHYHNTAITSQFALFIERNILNSAPVSCAGTDGLCNRNPAITGPEVICTTGQYELTDLPAGVTIVWEAQNGKLKIADGQGTNRINVSYLSSGIDVIKVTLTNMCEASLVITKTITIGTPVVNIDYSQNGSCNGSYQGWMLNASSPGTVTSWYWSVDNPSSGSWIIDQPYSPNTYVSVDGGGGISVTATNNCGTSRNGVTIWSNCYEYGLMASPNPTTDNVTVAVAEPKDVKSSNQKKALMYLIKVSDQAGNVKKQYKYSGVSNATIS